MRLLRQRDLLFAIGMFTMFATKDRVDPVTIIAGMAVLAGGLCYMDYLRNKKRISVSEKKEKSS